MSSQFHTLHCQEPWFSHLASGKKPVEGRKNSPKNALIQPGDFISFYCNDKSFVSEVTHVKKYPSVEAYLLDVSVEKALPGVNNFEDALKIYAQWSTKEEIENMGFLGIFIKTLPLEVKKKDSQIIKNFMSAN